MKLVDLLYLDELMLSLETLVVLLHELSLFRLRFGLSNKLIDKFKVWVMLVGVFAVEGMLHEG